MGQNSSSNNGLDAYASSETSSNDLFDDLHPSEREFSAIPAQHTPLAGRNPLASALTSPYPTLIGLNDKQFELHVDLAPSQLFRCANQTPIVIALDMTGSMVLWSNVIFKNLQLLQSEIQKHDYLQDPAISFAFIGDYEVDHRAPLQTTPFAWGRMVPEHLSKVWLVPMMESVQIQSSTASSSSSTTVNTDSLQVRYGGGNTYESYDLAAAWGAYRTELTSARKGIFFITGDESPYGSVSREALHQVLGLEADTDIPLATVFAALHAKFEVFLLRKRCDDDYYAQKMKLDMNILNARIASDWAAVVPEHHTIMLEDGDALVDVILGVFALYSSTYLPLTLPSSASYFTTVSSSSTSTAAKPSSPTSSSSSSFISSSSSSSSSSSPSSSTSSSSSSSPPPQQPRNASFVMDGFSASLLARGVPPIRIEIVTRALRPYIQWLHSLAAAQARQ